MSIMTERKPTDDLKDGLLLLLRAARGLSKEATPEKFEKSVQTGAKELVRVINDVGRAIGAELQRAAGGVVEEAHEARSHDVSPPPEASPSSPPAASPGSSAPASSSPPAADDKSAAS